MSNPSDRVLPIQHHLLTELDDQRLYRMIIETACDELAADEAALFLWTPGAHQLTYVAGSTSVGHERIDSGIGPVERLALQAARSGQPVLTKYMGSHQAVVAQLAAPLRIGDRVLGALYVARTHLRPVFMAEDQEALQRLADQTAVAIEHAQLYRTAHQRIERLEALHHISTAIASSLDLDTITSIALQELSGMFPLQAAQLVLVRPNPALPMQRRLWHNNQLTPLEITRRPAVGSLLARVLHDGIPRIEQQSSQRYASVSSAPGTLDVICVPLWDGQRAGGAIELVSQSVYRFTDADVQFVIEIGVPLIQALTNAQHYADTVKSEARQRALLEHANDAIMLLDARGRHIIDANRSMEVLTGYDRATLRSLLPESLFAESWQTISNGNLPAHGDQQPSVEARLLTNDQGDVPVSVGTSRVQYGNEELVLLIVRDIRDQQRVMQQMMQTEKLAAIGRLTSSIAHEVNNPLQAIYTSLDLLRKNGMPEEKRQRYVNMTFAEAERLVATVHRLIDFHRPSRDGMRPTQVLDILDSVLVYLDTQIQERNIIVVKDWQAPLPRIMAIYSHIKQVCTNLIANALDAMPDGGILTLRVYRDDTVQQGPHKEAWKKGQNGPSLVLEFSDTGFGISTHELHKIFEPFYTTKVTGTGLGLAVSYNIIQQHGGDLTATSTPGQGATFIMRFQIIE